MRAQVDVAQDRALVGEWQRKTEHFENHAITISYKPVSITR